MVVSFITFLTGIGIIIWGFWGDFVDKSPHPSPTIASRFEAGMFWLAVSFVSYLISKRKQDRLSG
jgi:hypothetical protein